MSLPSGGAALNVKLRKFDISKMDTACVAVIIGRRRSGKSFLLRDILWNHKTLPVATVISGTEESNSAYKNMVPPAFIFTDYSPTTVDNFVKRQRFIMKKIGDETANGGRSAIDPRSFFIMDDCMYDDEWTRDKNIRYLFMNGRWIKAFVIITMQYPLGVPPALRTQIDYTFILRAPTLSDRRKIYDNYASVFPSFEFFCQIMDQCTQNYECIVIDNTSLSNDITDCVFWYKAEPRGDFRIGDDRFWQHSAQYRVKGEEDVDNYNPSSHSRIRGPVISVKKTL